MGKFCGFFKAWEGDGGDFLVLKFIVEVLDLGVLSSSFALL